MIVVMKPGFTPEQMQAAVRVMEAGGVKVMVSRGSETTILGAEGNAAGIDRERLSLLPGGGAGHAVSEPYKMANRKYHPDDTVIPLPGGGAVGGSRLAGVCRPVFGGRAGKQIVSIARQVAADGACALRGGAFKPRTSPYSFQGMGTDGIRLLARPGRKPDCPLCRRSSPPRIWIS